METFALVWFYGRSQKNAEKLNWETAHYNVNPHTSERWVKLRKINSIVISC